LRKWHSIWIRQNVCQKNSYPLKRYRLRYEGNVLDSFGAFGCVAWDIGSLHFLTYPLKIGYSR
jgi:hypothetical protein